jgi:hypothetical protein
MTKERRLHKGNRSERREEERKGTTEGFGRKQKAVHVHEPINTM